MRAIVLTTSIANPGRFLAVALTVGLAGCLTRPTVQEHPPTRVATGFMGQPLLQKPGGPADAESRGGVGLVLETRRVDGRDWKRVITSDGSYGWTSVDLAASYPAVIRAALD